MGTNTLIVARTDSEAATFITNNIDPRDHAFIVGATKPGTVPLNAAVASGADESDWMATANLATFPNAVRAVAAGADLTAFEECVTNGQSLSEMQAAAALALGGEANVPYFDWEAPRAREGYYRIQPGTDVAIARAKAWAPYADLIWMETALPTISQAEEFANGVHAMWPGKR